MEAAAAQLEAARRAREAEARDDAIQEVEMVLETYFHNLDNTYNKLATINENMDDVEVKDCNLSFKSRMKCGSSNDQNMHIYESSVGPIITHAGNWVRSEPVILRWCRNS